MVVTVVAVATHSCVCSCSGRCGVVALSAKTFLYLTCDFLNTMKWKLLTFCNVSWMKTKQNKINKKKITRNIVYYNYNNKISHVFSDPYTYQFQRVWVKCKSNENNRKRKQNKTFIFFLFLFFWVKIYTGGISRRIHN